MESATITTRNLAINGMTGEVCVQKVTGALKGIRGVTTQSVKVGSATIVADQAGCDAACAAIGTAGYKAREADREGVRDAGRQREESNKTGDTQQSLASDKSGNQGGTPMLHPAGRTVDTAKASNDTKPTERPSENVKSSPAVMTK